MLNIGRIGRLLGRSLGRPTVYDNHGAMTLTMSRMLSMHTINDSLYLCTDKPRKIDIDKRSLRFTQTRENTKPIVLMISWFYGRPSQINKYAKLYTDNGMDVLVANISLIHFLFSIKKVEKFATQIIDLLANNESYYPEIFIHTFSAGAGMWGITQRMIKRDLDKYGKIPNRIIGQVWDSIAHPSMTIVAIPFALFPNNKVLQSFTRGLLWFHLKFYKTLWAHFWDAMDNFYADLTRSPALIIASKADKIGTWYFAEEVVEKWRKHGNEVTHKCFEDSEHIKHFQKYPEEYMSLLQNHWKLVKLLERK